MRLKQRQREYFLDAVQKAKSRAFDEHFELGLPFNQIKPVVNEVVETMEPYRYPGDSLEAHFGFEGEQIAEFVPQSEYELASHTLGRDFDWLSVHHRNEDMKTE